MSRGVLLWACAVTSLSVAVPSVFAVSEADWDLRYRGAVKSCILKSQRTQTCTRVIDGNPLELSGLAYTLLYKTVYPTVWRGVGEIARGVSMARVLAQPEDAPYWKRYNAELNYESLKKWAQYRAKKDGLEDCQKACLATCISSEIMEYDDRNLPTHWREGIGREKGVCRDFSGMAADLMRSLGLDAGAITGTDYNITEGQRPQKVEGHVMVVVKLPQGKFIMEPQNGECSFFDTSFSMKPRHITTESLNTKQL